MIYPFFFQLPSVGVTGTFPYYYTHEDSYYKVMSQHFCQYEAVSTQAFQSNENTYTKAYTITLWKDEIFD